MYTLKWGTISLSDRTRTNKSKSNMSFLRTCDKATYKEFEDLAAHYGFTIDQLKEDNAARVAMDVLEVQRAIREKYGYSTANLKRTKKLF